MSGTITYVPASGTTAAAATPAASGSLDFLTTLVSPDVAVVGAQKYLQLAAVAALGAAFQKKQLTGAWGIPFTRG